MYAIQCLGQAVACTTYGDLMTMGGEGFEYLLKIKCAWTSIDQRNVIDAEGRLHGRHLVQLIEHDI